MTDFRAAHGNAATMGRLTASECPPADELRAASGADPDRPERGPDGRFLPGNRTAKRGKLRAGLRGALVSLEAEADPAWKAARAWGRRAAKHRIAEYAQVHGAELSSGVCRMLSDAAELSADAAYLRARAAKDDNPELLRVAATLTAGSRQAERDAWAIAQLEADARRKSAPDDAHAKAAAAFSQWRQSQEAPK